MIKLRATKKEMREAYHHIISMRYCEAQSLLKYKSAFAYSAGHYGWACDYYEIDGVLISTGYRPISSKNTKYRYDSLRLFEEKAQDPNLTPEEINELLSVFVSGSIQWEKKSC